MTLLISIIRDQHAYRHCRPFGGSIAHRCATDLSACDTNKNDKLPGFPDRTAAITLVFRPDLVPNLQIHTSIPRLGLVLRALLYLDITLVYMSGSLSCIRVFRSDRRVPSP
jgi:hypothetical protein